MKDRVTEELPDRGVGHSPTANAVSSENAVCITIIELLPLSVSQHAAAGLRASITVHETSAAIYASRALGAPDRIRREYWQQREARELFRAQVDREILAAVEGE